VLRTLRIAKRIKEYDSRTLNDHIGKSISKTLLDSQTLDENLDLLKEISNLQFKPPFVEKLEHFLT
jgi:predicted hydrocarbon binding protein